MLYNIVMVFTIHQYEAAIGIYGSPLSEPPLPPPFPPYPSRLSQSTDFGRPASYIFINCILVGFSHYFLFLATQNGCGASPT